MVTPAGIDARLELRITTYAVHEHELRFMFRDVGTCHSERSTAE
jgi:hypothetical protein